MRLFCLYAAEQIFRSLIRLFAENGIDDSLQALLIVGR